MNPVAPGSSTAPVAVVNIGADAVRRLLGDILLYRDAAVAVNPERRLVATLLPIWNAREAGLLPATSGDAYRIACLVDDHDACTLERRGIVTPAIRKLRERRHDGGLPRPGQAPSQATPQAIEREPVRDPAPISPPRGWPQPAATTDPRQREYLRRAAGKTDEERLALLKEMFVPEAGTDEA